VAQRFRSSTLQATCCSRLGILKGHHHRDIARQKSFPSIAGTATKRHRLTMKTFSIFKHPDQRLEAIKQGLSIPGLLGGGFWLLWHRIWTIGALTTVGGLSVYFIFPSPEAYIYGIPYGHRFGLADIVNIGICGVVGFWGNSIRTSSLIDRGFEHVSTEQASTPDGARAAYLRRSTVTNSTPSFGRCEPS
jgi:hypothetical protein